MDQHGLAQFDLDSLGERVVKAARLAVAVHLFESLRSQPLDIRATNDTHGPAGLPTGHQAMRQRFAIGGAGPYLVTDDELPSAAGRA